MIHFSHYTCLQLAHAHNSHYDVLVRIYEHNDARIIPLLCIQMVLMWWAGRGTLDVVEVGGGGGGWPGAAGGWGYRTR